MIEPKIGDYVWMNDNLIKIKAIDYRGHDTVQKVELAGIEGGYQRWFWVEEVDIITLEENPEYFL